MFWCPETNQAPTVNLLVNQLFTRMQTKQDHFRTAEVFALRLMHSNYVAGHLLYRRDHFGPLLLCRAIRGRRNRGSVRAERCGSDVDLVVVRDWSRWRTWHADLVDDNCLPVHVFLVRRNVIAIYTAVNAQCDDWYAIAASRIVTLSTCAHLELRGSMFSKSWGRLHAALRKSFTSC